MAKIKRAKEPHRATALLLQFRTDFLFSLTQNKTKQSKNKTKAKKDMPLDDERERVDGVRIYVRDSHILPFYQNP